MSFRYLISVLLIVVAFSQDFNLGDLNTCAKSTLGNSLPKDEGDCFEDDSSSDTNCCLITATMQGISLNFCVALPKSFDIKEIEDEIAAQGSAATVKCSATSISLSLMLIAMLALFLF